LRTELLAGDDTLRAAVYGPLVLAAELGAGPVGGPSKIIPDGSTVPKGLAKPDAALKAAGADWVTQEGAGSLCFKGHGESGTVNLLPMYEVGDQRYAVYWQVGGEKKVS
jgi:hypothetical protein